VESRKRSRLCAGKDEQVSERSRHHQAKNSWGCTGFDIVIGRSGLRVRELFSVINGQIKINAEKDNVIRVNFGAERALAA